MFKKLIRPEILFLLGAVQALSPYVLWAFGGGIHPARFGVNYVPIAIWLSAYVSFWAGSRLINNGTPASAGFDLRPYSRSIVIISILTSLALIIQIVWAAHAYGALPIFSYVAGDGAMDVVSATDMQDDAAFGQFGLLIASTCVANGPLLLLIILSSQEKRRRVFVLGTLLLSLTLANVLNGKRQGLLITAMYIGIGLLLYAGSLWRAIAAVPFVPKSRLLRLAVLGSCVWIGVFLMGKMADLRTSGVSDGSGVNEIIRYLEFPLLNLAAQCDQSGGLGPYEFSLRHPLQHLLPFKMIDSFLAEDIPLPQRVEPTSPNGMFEYIQWGWGPLGILAFCFLLGITCSYVYKRSLSDIRYFLVYPSCAYGLLVAHSYNHFFILAYLPVPCVLYLLFARRILIPNHQIRPTNVKRRLPATLHRLGISS